MGCKATRINIILVLLLAFFYALVFSSKVTAQTMEVQAFPKRSVSFEIKPISLLANLVPGSRGFSGEFEASLGRNIAVVAGLSHFRFKTPDSSIAEQREDDNDKEIEKEVTSNEVSLGGRYYSNTSGHSWFTGFRLGGGTKNSLWDYESQDYNDTQMTYLSAFDTGFRWLWQSGMHLRLGGGLEFRRTIARNVNALSNSQGPDEVSQGIERNNRTDGIRFNPYFDFGVGITI
jgi:hypothetical protein